MPRLLKNIGLISAVLAFFSSIVFAEESITITTYYPSPYGSYRELRSQRMAMGNTYYDRATVCWDPLCPSGSTDVSATNPTLLVEGNVGIGTTSPNANAILDVSSTTKAFMPPRMTTAQKNAISSPTAGMVVYDTTLNKLCVYTGSAWQTVTSS